MNARALWAGMTWSRGLFVLFALNAVWIASLFLAPLTIAPGTFAFTVGGANTVDHWNLYSSPAFNWYAKLIYTIGDSQCHQLWFRSLWINGNQMPIDARMTILYIFGLFGMFWAMMTPASVSVSRGIANAFPGWARRWAERVGAVPFTALLLVVGLLPVALDGFTQLFSTYTQYESTNATRILTGVPGGLVTGLLLGMMVKSLKQFNLEYAAVRAARSPQRPDKV